MKFLKAVLIVIVIVAVSFFLLGLIAPLEFTGEVTGEYKNSPEEVWAVLTDYQGLAKRRAEIVSVEILGHSNEGHLQWKEFTDYGGFIAFEQVDSIPYNKLTVKMMESQFTMSATWTYQLKPKPNGGTIVTIHETSRVEPIFMRTIMYLAGRNSFLKQEQKNIWKALRSD